MEVQDRGVVNIHRLLVRLRDMLSEDSISYAQLHRIQTHVKHVKTQLGELDAEGDAASDRLRPLFVEVSCSLSEEQDKLEAKERKQREAKEAAVLAKQQQQQQQRNRGVEQVKSESPTHTTSLVRRKVKRNTTKREELFAGSSTEAPELSEEALQNAITSEMAEMTAALKQIATGVGQSLEDDNQIIEKTREKTAKNLSKIDKVNVKLVDQIKRSGGCWLWILLLLVFFNFIGMILFMRISR